MYLSCDWKRKKIQREGGGREVRVHITIPGSVQIAGDKYESSFSDNTYKMHMKLMIRSVAMSDYGSYKCISKNSLGETDGSIKLYRKYDPRVPQWRNYFYFTCQQTRPV